MFQVPGMGQSHDGLKQDAAGLPGGPKGHLPVGAVEVGFALKADDVPPSVPGKEAVGVWKEF